MYRKNDSIEITSEGTTDLIGLAEQDFNKAIKNMFKD